MDQDGKLRSELTGQILGFVVSQAIFVAAQLGIPDLLAAGPRQLADLATGEGRFAVFAETLRMAQTGQPAFDAAFGAVWEEYLAHNPEARARHRRLLAASRQELGRALANDASADGETVVDVGGGDGVLLETLLRARVAWGRLRPRLGGRRGRLRIAAAGLEARCQVVAASFFRDVPDGADVYVLAHVLHNWDDDHAREILHGVRRATPDHGRLVVAEEVLAPPNQARVVMLAIGGQELTPGQWRALLADGGFELTRIRPAPNASFIDALPLR